MAKKYYWLKLHKDFFKRHDIRIVEGMDNGKDYILFYLKLLLESVDHDGTLRFNDSIPYDEKMLSLITNTNIDIVRAAIQIFKSLNLMEVMDDKTIYMTQTQAMLGVETEWAKKKRDYRDNLKQLEDTSETKKDNVRQEIELEKELEIEIDKKIVRFTPPNLNDVINYCKERNKNIDAEKWYNFYQSKDWMIGKNKMKDWKASVRTWENNQLKEKPKSDDELSIEELQKKYPKASFV